MPFPLRMTFPRRASAPRAVAAAPRRDGVFAVVAVAAVVALSIAANARRRVGSRMDALRNATSSEQPGESAEQALAEPVTGA